MVRMSVIDKRVKLEVIKGVIFDLDGVIVDTAKYHYVAWKRLAHELGYHLTEADNERLKGVSRMTSLEIILELARVDLNPAHKDLLANKKNLWFNEYLNQMTQEEIYPGVKPLLRSLRSEGLKVGLASSSKNARTVIRALQIEQEFDTIVDGNMIRNTKPHPEIFLTAATRLALDPGNCVVVEDAEAGVEAALAAGMMCVGIGSPRLLAKADKVFTRTEQINLSTLENLDHHHR